MLSIVPDRPIRDQWNQPRENGTTLFDRNKISNRTEAFHLRFDRNFDYFSVRWDWKREFLKMKRQVSVGPDRPVKEDHLWRGTTFYGKFPPGPKHSIYVSTKISGNFGIMASTQDDPLLSNQTFKFRVSLIYNTDTERSVVCE